MQQPTLRLRLRRRPGRGFSLIDALIAMALLAFGILGMTKLQARALAQATESQSRSIAMQFGDELISTALVDAANKTCYTLPAAGACAVTAARALTTDWNTRLVAALPTASATSTYTSTTGRLDVVITWTGKESGATRTMKASTDVRQ
jgi:type IV pilus assembly protein PilV